MRKTLLFVLLIIGLSINAQKLYELSTIQKIEITFVESNWDALLDAQKSGEQDYIKATSVAINGEIFTDVGVKYKGNSTYSANQTKNPFHIELDTYQEQDYNGYTDIKLSNVAKDPSFLREVLSYDILRQYMEAPDANYANVYVNGTLLGLYSNSESVSKSFVKDKFGSNDNTFVKCNPPGGAGANTTDLPNLVYISADSADYMDAYELKSDKGWDELIMLCKAISDDIDNIEDILDVDRALWMLAFNNVLVNLDSYSGGFAQNYYLYRDDEGKFNPVMWDFNESFGCFSQAGGSVNISSTASKQQMTHLLHSNDASYPLIKQLLSIPMYKRMYIAHMKTMLLENFDNNAYYEKAQEMQAIIDSSVQVDGNKFFTYANFTSNLDSDVSSSTGGRPGKSSGTPGIKNLMEARCDYLLALPDFTASAPEISGATLSTETPVINSSITMTVSASDATAVYVGYRSDSKKHFTRVQMYDDGSHNDGTADDGVYGAEIDVNSSLVSYYIYAENANAGIFSPRRAEHEYHSFTASSISAPLSDLVINEFMASNASVVSDQDGDFDDWIELYNNGTESIDISGYSLSDDYDELEKWSFPAGFSIGPNEYLVVWADKDDDQKGLHTTFKLSSSGESIYLSDSTGVLIDEVNFLSQETNASYGRFENGTGNFKTLSPSYGSVNIEVSAGIEEEIIPSIKIYPNPAFDMIYVNSSKPLVSIEIYSYSGVKVIETNGANELDISSLKPGIYCMKMYDGNTHSVKQLIKQ